MYTIIKLIASITACVASNSFSNAIGKKSLKTNGDTYRFNGLMCAAALILFLIMSLGKSTSMYTVLMGVAFGLLTMLANIFRLHALATGPMHITVLFTTCHMIIPTMSGAIMFGEPFSIGKFIAMLFLIFFVYLSLDKSSSGKISTKWIINCLICFLASGIIGVMQKIHQNSIHKEEVESFLAVAFACSLILSIILTKHNKCVTRFSLKEYLFAIVCGVSSFIVNIFNLELSGILSSQLFFPLANGIPLVLSSIIAIVVFKEKVTPVQSIGLIGGIISLIAICLF